MNAKRLIFLLALLFALGCGGDWNPMAPPLPDTQSGSDGPECNERHYGGHLPPHCIPPVEE